MEILFPWLYLYNEAEEKKKKKKQNDESKDDNYWDI